MHVSITYRKLQCWSTVYIFVGGNITKHNAQSRLNKHSEAYSLNPFQNQKLGYVLKITAICINEICGYKLYKVEILAPML